MIPIRKNKYKINKSFKHKQLQEIIKYTIHYVVLLQEVIYNYIIIELIREAA